jgi:hypothetical protein
MTYYDQNDVGVYDLAGPLPYEGTMFLKLRAASRGGGVQRR